MNIPDKKYLSLAETAKALDMNSTAVRWNAGKKGFPNAMKFKGQLFFKSADLRTWATKKNNIPASTEKIVTADASCNNANGSSNNPNRMSLLEASEFLGISRSSLRYQMGIDGFPEFFKDADNRLYFNRAELEAWRDKQKTNAPLTKKTSNNPDNINLNDYLTISEVAQLLGITATAVRYKSGHKGFPKAHSIDGVLRYPIDQLQVWLNDNPAYDRAAGLQRKAHLSIQEVAAVLGVSVTTVRNKMGHNSFPTPIRHTQGHRVLFDANAFGRWLALRGTAPQKELFSQITHIDLITPTEKQALDAAAAAIKSTDNSSPSPIEPTGSTSFSTSTSNTASSTSFTEAPETASAACAVENDAEPADEPKTAESAASDATETMRETKATDTQAASIDEFICASCAYSARQRFITSPNLHHTVYHCFKLRRSFSPNTPSILTECSTFKQRGRHTKPTETTFIFTPNPAFDADAVSSTTANTDFSSSFMEFQNSFDNPEFQSDELADNFDFGNMFN